jgi:hypothetical protein
VKKIPEGRRFKPGQSGNPKGRPKKEDTWKYIFSDLLTLEDISMPDGSKITRKQAIAIRMVQEALKGRVEAANFIGKYTESPEPTRLSPVDSDGNPLTGAVFTMKKETLESWQKRIQKDKDASSSK